MAQKNHNNVKMRARSCSGDATVFFHFDEEIFNADHGIGTIEGDVTMDSEEKNITIVLRPRKIQNRAPTPTSARYELLSIMSRHEPKIRRMLLKQALQLLRLDYPLRSERAQGKENEEVTHHEMLRLQQLYLRLARAQHAPQRTVISENSVFN